MDRNYKNKTLRNTEKPITIVIDHGDKNCRNIKTNDEKYKYKQLIENFSALRRKGTVDNWTLKTAHRWPNYRSGFLTVIWANRKTGSALGSLPMCRSLIRVPFCLAAPIPLLLFAAHYTSKPLRQSLLFFDKIESHVKCSMRDDDYDEIVWGGIRYSCRPTDVVSITTTMINKLSPTQGVP